jgi:hypothetical protein
VPLLIFVIWAYTMEIRKRSWNRVFCGIAFFAGEFIWEMYNALVCYFSRYSAMWVVVMPSAYMILVGLNIEIATFFALFPLMIFNCIDAFDKDYKISVLGRKISNRLVVSLILGLLCVFLEVILNQWGALVWDWPFWNWPNIYLQVIAYSTPIILITRVYDRRSMRFKKLTAIFVPLLAIILFIIFTSLGWV